MARGNQTRQKQDEWIATAGLTRSLLLVRRDGENHRVSNQNEVQRDLTFRRPVFWIY